MDANRLAEAGMVLAETTALVDLIGSAAEAPNPDGEAINRAAAMAGSRLDTLAAILEEGEKAQAGK